MPKKRIRKRPAESSLSSEDKALFETAYKTARVNLGHAFTFYLPGMIRYGSERGRYPAISITGDRCELQCEHCKGRLLNPMIKISAPDELVRVSRRFAMAGHHGILLTGGSDLQGRLPWERYAEAIKEIRDQTQLYISAHTGFPDQASCLLLKESGVSQGLIDVMGDEKTATRVYHLHGLGAVLGALEGIAKSGLGLIPHVVAGLSYGRIESEYKALEIIRRFHPEALVIVVLTPLYGTPMAHVHPPTAIEVARLIAKARLLMPQVPISLGCERPRDSEGELMERLAIRAGATRMAIWSEGAVQEAKNIGLTVRFQATCCSLEFREDFLSTV
jgi:uncharacterized radical SAM superfamily protein